MKQCSKCKQNKDTHQFYPDKRSKDKLYSSCKQCFAKLKKLYRNKNKSIIIQKDKLYRIKNKEKRAEYNKKWDKENPEKIYLIRKKSIEKHKDRVIRWRQSEKGKFCLCNSSHKRRVKIKSSGSFTFKEWEDLIKKNNNKCLMCKEIFTEKNPATIDHIIPISKGGTNTIENIQPLHGVCNSKKGTKIISLI